MQRYGWPIETQRVGGAVRNRLILFPLLVGEGFGGVG